MTVVITGITVVRLTGIQATIAATGIEQPRPN